MSEFLRAATQLVHHATTATNDTVLRESIDAALGTFSPKARAMKGALTILEQGIKKSRGRATQVLLLAVGALVEAGLKPELAWPMLAPTLSRALLGAERFARLCVEASRGASYSDATRHLSAKLQESRPADFASFQQLRAVCIAANACLSRSLSVRAIARASRALAKAVDGAELLRANSEDVSALSDLVQVLARTPLVVLHPATGCGWRFLVSDVATNAELYVLVLDALLGDPEAGQLRGKRPSAKALALLKDPNASGSAMVDAPFAMLPWNGLHGGGAALSRSSTPAQIPLLDGVRTVVLEKRAKEPRVELAVPYDGLSPKLELKGKLKQSAVDAFLLRTNPPTNAQRKTVARRKRA
jgi:hypothetical protein